MDKVSGEALCRAWGAGAGPGKDKLTIDVDSTVVETYGQKKQGGADITYHGGRGYHPLLATAAELGDVIHSRLRGGRANCGRGAANFVSETLLRARRAGAQGPIVVRADSGFYARQVAETCRRHKARYSITVRLSQRLHRAIAGIEESSWRQIPYWDGSASVAETSYLAFPKGRGGIPVRLIVRRV